MNNFIQYLKDSYEELKKVTWPTQKETINYTILVVAVSLGVATFLGGLDYIFNFGLENFIELTDNSQPIDIPVNEVVPSTETTPSTDSGNTLEVMPSQEESTN